MPKRWHFWWCFEGPDRERATRNCIEDLAKEGLKAKIWAPRPEHKTSGHIHVVVLTTTEELMRKVR